MVLTVAAVLRFSQYFSFSASATVNKFPAFLEKRANYRCKYQNIEKPKTKRKSLVIGAPISVDVWVVLRLMEEDEAYSGCLS